MRIAARSGQDAFVVDVGGGMGRSVDLAQRWVGPPMTLSVLVATEGFVAFVGDQEEERRLLELARALRWPEPRRPRAAV